MRKFFEELKDFPKKGDMVLLVLCLIVAGFGLVCMASATSAPKFEGNFRYIAIQVVAICLGVIAYALVSSVDIEFLSEYRGLLVAFNCFLLLLLIPFGTDNDTGNRSWLDIPLVPVMIQPAEICKIAYIIIMASVMSSHQNRISHPVSVMHMVMHLGLLVGLNMVLSSDAGVSLIFVFIFIGMAFAGGVKMIWFILGGGALVAAAPIIWNHFMDPYQQKRILVLFDPTIDPQGIKERYHMIRSLKSLTGGGIAGQGLFEGNRTQAGGVLPSQHTDFIFSAIGEELGYLGCALVIIMMFCLVARCIWVGSRSTDYMRRVVCFGAASALIFQVCVNIGMCIGVVPVIGLTLPLISYGGSSIVTIFAMLGLVSGVHARPSPRSHERYIQPPR